MSKCAIPSCTRERGLEENKTITLCGTCYSWMRQINLLFPEILGRNTLDIKQARAEARKVAIRIIDALILLLKNGNGKINPDDPKDTNEFFRESLLEDKEFLKIGKFDN